MKYLSVCSGIEAATAAWHHMGWQPAAFSEIEPFPSAVLAHHYPDVPNWGDMTKFKEWPDADVDVLVGGTPCQSFSVAGLRKGLDDPRGNLMLTYLAIAAKYRPRWMVWENVPGVLSSNGGLDFASLLRGMGELGYGFAYRVLDAQYFGVAQRRRRVFVVGCAGDWRAAAAVLFERHSLQGHPAPSRKTREDVAGTLDASLGRSRGAGTPPGAVTAAGIDFQNSALSGDIAGTLDAEGQKRGNRGHGVFATTHRMVAFGEYSDDGSASAMKARDYKDATDLVTVAFNARQDPDAWADRTGPLDTDGGTQAVAFALATAMQVRRLTPRECERLQGFQDDFTAIPWRKAEAADCPDGLRYKALGNSMAVPVMRWIGERIQAARDRASSPEK